MARGFSEKMMREAGLRMPVPPPTQIRDMTVHLDPDAVQALREVGPTLAHKGRRGDTLLVHLDPVEAETLKAAGGSGAINPRTGLREFEDDAGNGNPGGGHNGDGAASNGGYGGGSSSASGPSGPGDNDGGYTSNYAGHMGFGFSTPDPTSISGFGMQDKNTIGPGGNMESFASPAGALTGYGVNQESYAPKDSWTRLGQEIMDAVKGLVNTPQSFLESLMGPLGPPTAEDPGIVGNVISQVIGGPFGPAMAVGGAISRASSPEAQAAQQAELSEQGAKNSTGNDWQSTVEKLPTADDTVVGKPAKPAKPADPLKDLPAFDAVKAMFDFDQLDGTFTGTVRDKDKLDMTKGFSKSLGNALSSFGRNGDTMVAHINEDEAALLKSMGGSGTINPVTGLPEFYAAADVQQAYKDILGRDAEAGGLAHWTAANPNGTAAELRAQIAGSAEAKSREAAVQKQVSSAYQSNLGRAPEAGGLSSWTNMAMTGGQAGLDKALAGIKNSDEAQNKVITSAYQGMLGRAPESDAAVQGWNTAMDDLLTQGKDPYAGLVDGFKNSAEYKGLQVKPPVLNPPANQPLPPVQQPAPTAPVPTTPAAPQQDYTAQLMAAFQQMMQQQQAQYAAMLKAQQSAVPAVLQQPVAQATDFQAGLTSSPSAQYASGIRKRTPRIDPLTGAVTWDEDTPAGYAAVDPNRAQRRSGFGQALRF